MTDDNARGFLIFWRVSMEGSVFQRQLFFDFYVIGLRIKLNSRAVGIDSREDKFIASYDLWELLNAMLVV